MIYGPNIDQSEMEKVVKNPFPDALFSRLKAKHAWQCKKVG